MNLGEVEVRTQSLDRVSSALWRKTLLTSCVLAGCLALIAVLALL
jgi:hypothetical protein